MDVVQRVHEDEKKKLLEIKTFAQLQSCFAKIQLPKSWRLWETESEMHVYQPISVGGILTIQKSLLINSDLTAKFYVNSSVSLIAVQLPPEFRVISSSEEVNPLPEK